MCKKIENLKLREISLNEKEIQLNTLVENNSIKQNEITNFENIMHNKIEKMKQDATEYPKKLLKKIENQKVELNQVKQDLDKKEKKILKQERELDLKQKKIINKEKELKEQEKVLKDEEE